MLAVAIEDKIAAVLKQLPDLQGAHWGAHAVDAATGRVVFSRNAGQTFVPASNTKLFSTALALKRLGPDHRFVTTVRLDENGDLRLAGGGDPTLSARPIPYKRNGGNGNPLAPLEALAADVVRAGIREVRGDVIGDDTAYVWEPYPDGWSQDDTMFEYGAPVSALIVHDNFLSVKLKPGSPAELSVVPAVPYFTFDVRLRRDGGRLNKVAIHRAPGRRHVELTGLLNRETLLELAVDDPARYAAFAFRDALTRQGVVIRGEPVARHRWPGDPPADLPAGREIARRVSPPLIESLKTINKVSQNLQAEVVLREVARQTGAEPARAAGIEELKKFLTEIGIGGENYNFQDGSGLSRLTLASPLAAVTLLKFMDRPEWQDLMPVGGVDGTLYLRYRDFKNGRITAKTGTLSHVGTLSGYAENASGARIVFSVMVNNANANSAAIRDFIDRIVVALLE